MSNLQTFDLPIRGMTCASCAGRVERALSRVPEVQQSSVNLATEQARITAPRERLDELLAAVEQAGYSVPLQSLELNLGGMTCASCAGRIERALQKVTGVRRVSVNLASERAHVEMLEGTASAALIAAVTDAGYTASLELENQLPELDDITDLADLANDYTGVVAYYKDKDGKQQKMEKGDMAKPKRLAQLYANVYSAKKAVDREWAKLQVKQA